MFPICVKYFFIIFCSFYLYRKLLYLPFNKKHLLIHIISSALLSILIYGIRLIFTLGSIPILISLFTLITYKLYKESANVSIVSSLISIVSSYVMFLFATFIFMFLSLFLIQLSTSSLLYQISFFIIGVIQMLLATMLFLFSRLKTGMPFLKQQGASDIGVFIAILSLLIITFLDISRTYSLSLLIPLFFIILSGILIFFWWKSKLTENYLKQAKEREINELKDKIEELKEYNATLETIIHKDNKSVPAMLYSVNETISETTNNADEAQRKRLYNLLSELNNMTAERKGLILFSEKDAKSNYSTGVPSIDSQLKFQAATAYANQTSFEVMISDKLNIIVPEQISVEDLRTLIADLLTNALIAVKSETKRNVLFHTHIENDTFYIDFYDSGAPFDTEVLEKMGKERITTHLDDGGSGIGYMTIFEILNRCNGTWTVEDDLNLELYTKKVSISFKL